MVTIDNTPVSIGKKIQLFRMFIGHTQPGFAEIAGISQKSIHNYESEKFKPRPDMIARIETAFNVRLETITAHLNYETANDGD